MGARKLVTERFEVSDIWDTPDPQRLLATLGQVGRPWWVAAGLAIDLFVGRTTREHHDADVAIDRKDAAFFHSALISWQIGIAVDWTEVPGNSNRVLELWDAGASLPSHADALWCRPNGQEPFVFELLLNKIVDGTWHFKRDDTVTLAIDRFGLVTHDGIPYLAPEVVLLHKATSTAFDQQDTQDFEASLPLMTGDQRAWLSDSLTRFDTQHPWLLIL